MMCKKMYGFPHPQPQNSTFSSHKSTPHLTNPPTHLTTSLTHLPTHFKIPPTQLIFVENTGLDTTPCCNTEYVVHVNPLYAFFFCSQLLIVDYYILIQENSKILDTRTKISRVISFLTTLTKCRFSATLLYYIY